ncbi:hypothetical protein [Sphingorhabdus lacus]|uniref:Uncharacterized protein n=1 Tax=Sphingorhabdus lacus TaxID=392610 RepID=A0A6I6LCJ3_9SPHN|nr:hypothetical protein [Sphingorhabdus lacus]QGY81776.1 hypothetical protein EUU25_14800 [Sphingorhabdus lacus]
MSNGSRLIRRETLLETLAAIKSTGSSVDQITLLPGGSVQISIVKPDHKIVVPSPATQLAWRDVQVLEKRNA